MRLNCRSIKVLQRSLASLSFLALIVAGVAFGPHPAAAEPFAYVTNASSNNVSVIDTASNTVIDTVQPLTLGDPIAVAITADGARAYVINFLTDIVSVIDTDPSSLTFNTEVAFIGGGVVFSHCCGHYAGRGQSLCVEF